MNSFIKWIGGKKALRKRIIAEFPQELERYIEVFGGAGWVLFGSDKHAKFEVFNDIDGNLINLYRCIKFHSEELQRELSLVPHSREVFKSYLSQIEVEGLTDIQRAARYYIIIRSSFGANREDFATGIVNLEKKLSVFSEVSTRLSNVIIENRDFEHLIKTYDREKAFFYLDPPYYKAEKFYSSDFSAADHVRLHDLLGKIKGKFLLSYNADKFIEDLYSDYNIIHIERYNNLSSNNGQYKEVLIKNY